MLSGNWLDYGTTGSGIAPLAIKDTTKEDL